MEEPASVPASGPAASPRVLLHPLSVTTRTLAEAPHSHPDLGRRGLRRAWSPPGLARAARLGRWGRPEGRPSPSGHGGAVPGLGPSADRGRRLGPEAPLSRPGAGACAQGRSRRRLQPPRAPLPALIMPWPFSESIKKRACRYLLQRYLGHFLQEKLSLEQLSLDLYQGTGSLAQVPLDKWVRAAGGQPGGSRCPP